MAEIKEETAFSEWLHNLRDERARARIAARILRLKAGHIGDVRFVGAGVSELRINYGPGYRIYFVQRGKDLYILLCGGDKSSQTRDIKIAQKMAKEV